MTQLTPFAWLSVLKCCLVGALGLLHRTKRYYVISASLMCWTQRTPSRAASVTRAFMEAHVFTLVSQQRIRIILTWVSISKLLLTSYIKACRVRKVKWGFSNVASKVSVDICSLTFFPVFFTGRVLVHCIMGVSRSATLILAYLMLKERLTLRDALRQVVQKRAIYPNRNFLSLLLKLDEQLERKRRLCPLLWHPSISAQSFLTFLNIYFQFNTFTCCE